ncbi:MAG: hypothetical protein AAFV07_13255 [Bacteroidota bacterium]
MHKTLDFRIRQIFGEKWKGEQPVPGEATWIKAGWPRSPRCRGGLERGMGLRRFFAYFFGDKKVGPAEGDT